MGCFVAFGVRFSHSVSPFPPQQRNSRASSARHLQGRPMGHETPLERRSGPRRPQSNQTDASEDPVWHSSL